MSLYALRFVDQLTVIKKWMNVIKKTYMYIYIHIIHVSISIYIYDSKLYTSIIDLDIYTSIDLYRHMICYTLYYFFYVKLIIYVCPSMVYIGNLRLQTNRSVHQEDLEILLMGSIFA